jgi:hypothetical protein
VSPKKSSAKKSAAKKSLAKKPAKKFSGIRNRPLQDFLLAMAVDDAAREKYSHAKDDEERRTILREDFKMGPKTIPAVVEGTAGDVKAMFGVSDQQGFKHEGLKGATRSAKKR